MRAAGDANDFTPDGADDLFAPEFSQATHGFVVGSVIRRSSLANHTKAQADTEANLGVGRALVVDQPDANTFSSLRAGNHHAVTISSHGFGAFGVTLWLSQGTAGLITATEPATRLRLYLGFVIDANTIMWEPWSDWQEV